LINNLCIFPQSVFKFEAFGVIKADAESNQ
jgi:hypothetical protein